MCLVGSATEHLSRLGRVSFLVQRVMHVCCGTRDVVLVSCTHVDGSRDSSDSWTGFTQFTLLNEKPPDGFLWSGERLTKRPASSRPDHLWPELWKSMGKHAKLKEKQKWSLEKTKVR